MKPQYETTTLRGTLAVFGSAFVGGFLYVLIVTISSFIADRHNGYPFRLLLDDFVFLGLVGLGISIVWLVGIFAFGLIPWMVLHDYGYRQWYFAVAAGAVIPPVIFSAISLFIFDDLEFGFFSLILCPSGAIVGWSMWRIAYRRVKVD